MYKYSPSKYVSVFGSKVGKEKLQGTEIQCRFGDSDICLNFRKRIGLLRNGREPIFVTILLPEFISGQVVRLALSNFGEVVSVFRGRRKFNRSIRNGKRHVRIFPTGGDPAILPNKISFHGNIQRDVLFAQKVSSVKQGNLVQFFACDFQIYKKDTRNSQKFIIKITFIIILKSILTNLKTLPTILIIILKIINSHKNHLQKPQTNIITRMNIFCSH